MESKRLFGKIYFPENPTKAIDGAWLNISNKSIFVEIPTNSYYDNEWPIIHGQFTGMDNVTLVYCWSGGGSSGMGGTFQRINATIIIEGVKVSKYEELLFDKFTFHSEALTNWVKEPAGIKWIDNEHFHIPKPKLICSTRFDKFEVSIYWQFLTSYSSEILSSNMACTIEVKCTSKVALREIINFSKIFKRLILFLTNKNPEFNEYMVYLGDQGYSALNTNTPLNDHKFSQYIKIHYSDVVQNLSHIIQKWHETEKLHPVLDLVLEKCLNTEMSNKGYFLNVCVGLETFHREFVQKAIGKQPSPNAEHKATLVGLIGNNQALLKWFSDRSAGWDGPSLQDRLDYFKDTIATIIGRIFSISAEDFIVKVKQTRNEIAHFGIYDNRFTELGLLLASKVIEYLLRLEILKILGVDANKWINEAKINLATLAKINDVENNPLVKVKS